MRAAAREADIKVRWREPTRVTVSMVDWQSAAGALLALSDDDLAEWRDMPSRCRVGGTRPASNTTQTTFSAARPRTGHDLFNQRQVQLAVA